MGKKSTKTKRKSELKVIFFIILAAAALFIISTYAWFSTQRNVSITNLNGTVEVAEGLEISLDAERWANEIVLGEGEGKMDLEKDAYLGHRNLLPTEMLPVSTLGTTTGENNKSLIDLKMYRGKVTNTKELTNIVQVAADDKTITDPENAKFAGYFAFDIFLKNSSKNDEIDDILQLNYDSSVTIMPSEGGGDKSLTGLQNTVRVAFAKYGGVADVNAKQDAILAATGALKGDVYITDAAIWEPNASDHVEYIVTNNNNLTWSATDKALYGNNEYEEGRLGFINGTKMPTYALKDNLADASYATLKMDDLYNWDLAGTGKANAGILQKQNALQTTTKKDKDTGAITSYEIAEGVKNLKSTKDGTTDFVITPNAVIRLRVYVWLEGQDVDCINYASHGGGVTINIGLVKGSDEGTFAPVE